MGLMEYPDLSRHLTKTAIHAKSYAGLTSFGLGVLMTSLLVKDGPSPFMSAFCADDWNRTDWVAWAKDRTSLIQIKRFLSDDDLAADIDRIFGQGAALRLGKMVTENLRDKTVFSNRLTHASQVMGQA